MMAGFIDAIAFLYLGGYFVSFMSGNTTQMAATAAGQQWASAGKAAGLIGLFVVGVTIGSLVGRVGRGDGRLAILCTASALVFAAGLIHALADGVAPLLVTALATGVINAVLQRVSEVKVGITFVTGILVRVGQQLADALCGGPRWLWLRDLRLWAALPLGGATGALVYQQLQLSALWVAAGVLLAITGLAWLSESRG
ncbi:DUF1275 domain-containing protein [Mycobacterium sp. CBMA271]|nr:hypothetical protein [Mycobacteroides sp. CBMA 326]MUM20389.1 DUF1275 domain-containing protein [Mycobacteroides sp. CBMA 271]